MSNELQSMPATSLLSLFETTKDQRASFVESVLSSIESGTVDPLKVHLHIKMMEEVIKLLNSNGIYKGAVLDAAGKYGEKSFQFQNAKVEIKEVGVKYDFSKCDDNVLSELNIQMDLLSQKIKARETMLKSVDGAGMMLVDPATGEAMTVYPPAKSSTTSIAITLK